jgi:pimeloyl-ACP methyl ester carboxylesterase
MEHDYSAFCHGSASYKVEYSDLPTGVKLLTVVFTPSEPCDAPAIVFIPGLISIIENFKGTLIELTRCHTVYYIETREKNSAIINDNHRFSVDEITSDIIYFTEQKFSAGEPYVMTGYSLGATVIAEAFSHLKAGPEAVVLIEPNGSFPFHGWLLLLARIARYVYKPVKPFLKWYLRTFIINLKQDHEMYLINCRNLDAAEPVRLGKAIRQLSSYLIGDCSEKITVPTLVVVASKDRFHNHNDGSGIARKIRGAAYLDMSDNRRTHSAEMGQVISAFISSPAQRPFLADQLLQDIF